jgi:hypothetical protein
MANEVTKASGEKQLPSTYKGIGKEIAKVEESLGNKIDVAKLERILGTIVDPGLVNKFWGPETYVLKAVIAQRNVSLKRGEKGEPADLVGTPKDGERTHLRGVIKALLAAFLNPQTGKFLANELILRCRVRPDHPGIPAVENILHTGAAIIVKQESWKVTSLPKMKVIGVGLDELDEGGHDPALLAAAKERGAKDVVLPAA